MNGPVRVVALLSALLLAPATWAGQASEAAPVAPTAALPAARFAPGRYQVVAPQTKVHFHVKSLLGAFDGDFIDPTGAVTIDAAHPNNAAIDISFPVEKMSTGEPANDVMLKGDNLFDAAKFPFVRFLAADALIGSSEAMTITGELTMHGQTRPISITAHLTGIVPDATGGKPSLHFSGETSVLRSDFEMGFGRPFVSNRVDLTIDASFHPD